jgi:hypothetical protein
VTAFRSEITRQLSEIGGYYSGRSTDREVKEEGNKDFIEDLGDENAEDDEGQGDSRTEEEKESETADERDAHLDN